MNNDTRLLRQVHQSFIRHGRITSQVFKPTPKDNKQLSVYDGDQITPENAWIHYTVQLSLPSIGVVAVTFAECINQGLRIIPDPSAFPEHVLIDFTGLTNKQIKDVAKRLRSKAIARGWLYRPHL